jgi:hypothetical protein
MLPLEPKLLVMWEKIDEALKKKICINMVLAFIGVGLYSV